jgi:DNA-binding response OmpR family regulator
VGARASVLDGGAKIRAVAGQAYASGAFRPDVAAHELTRDRQPVPLPAKAFDTLARLVEHHERG